jgi:hypothetical protein
MISKILILTGIFASAAVAQVVELRMNEVPFQAVNGLSVTKGGITFSFTDTSGASFNASNGGNLTYTQDPVIEGQTSGELLTVNYSVPVYTIQFGLALSSSNLPTTMATVTLFHGATALGSYEIPALCPNAALGCGSDSFTNGQYNYNGALGPVTSMTVQMNGPAASAFGLGELFVDLGPAVIPAARPITLTFLGMLLAGLAVFLQRKQLLA